MSTNTKCRKIERLLYLTDDEMNPAEFSLLAKHLASCPSCVSLRKEFLASRQMALRLKDDIPAYPDFTLSTDRLIQSGDRSSNAKTAVIDHPYWRKSLAVIRYASTIAASLLLFLLLSEQTLSVRKIATLEHRIQSEVIPSEAGLIDRITMARSLFTIKEWNDLTAGLHVTRARLAPQDILRIRSLVENRIRSERRNELLVKRNAFTFKKLIK